MPKVTKAVLKTRGVGSRATRAAAADNVVYTTDKKGAKKSSPWKTEEDSVRAILKYESATNSTMNEFLLLRPDFFKLYWKEAGGSSVPLVTLIKTVLLCYSLREMAGIGVEDMDHPTLPMMVENARSEMLAAARPILRAARKDLGRTVRALQARYPYVFE